ncbi:MAG TPA: MFS transporter, partial [Bauldia sp.]|nr:MFS transporter [Bauldia sp.]
DVQAHLGVGPGDLSLGLLGTPVGTLIALPFAGRLIHRLSARSVIRAAFPFYCLAFLLPGWAWSVPSLFASLLLIGMAQPVVDVAMNVEADRIERDGGRRIMNTCHGFWSAGSMVGGVSGATFAGWGVGVPWHYMVIAAIGVPVSLLLANALPVTARVHRPDEMPPPWIALPTKALLGVCIFAFGMLLVEGSALDWSGSFLQKVIGVSPAATGIGFGAFALFMAGGRFMGDRMSERYGPVLVARTCAVICLFGMIVLATAGSLPIAVAGLAAAGLGVSVAAPLAVSAAAGRRGRPAAVNVAALSLISFGGFLVEPPLVGFVAEYGGLRWGLAATIPAIIASILLAGHVRRGPVGPVPPSPLPNLAA